MTGASAAADWSHQEAEFRLHRTKRSRALLWSMRTGKSRSIIKLAEWLWEQGLIEAVVVLAPNGVHDNWTLRQIPTHGCGINRTLAWSYPERDAAWQVQRLAALTEDNSLCYLDWFCVNNESIQFEETRKAIGRFIWKTRKRPRKILLVCDESSDFGTPGSNRTQFAVALGERAAFVRILDGTVVEDSPLKAFSQYQILQKGALGCRTAEEFNAKFADYEKTWTRQSGKRHSFPKLVGYKNLDVLRGKMAEWSSVVLREDCTDMPELLRVLRSYRPSPEQLDAYERMRLDFAVTLEDNTEVSVPEAAVRLIKLQQILSGYIVDSEGELHDIPGKNPRLDLLANELEFDPGKTIVWCRFRPDVFRVAKRLRELGYGVVTYVGGMSKADKNHSVDSFQSDRGVKVFVGTPIRGLELSEADTTIWYSHTFHALLRAQADERATKMGGSATTSIDFCAQTPDSGGVDLYILDNQARKRSISEDLARGGLKKVLQEVKL